MHVTTISTSYLEAVVFYEVDFPSLFLRNLSSLLLELLDVILSRGVGLAPIRLDLFNH